MSFSERTELLIGVSGIERLKNARVAVFGVGGVGSFAAEALVRAGVGHITLVDGDVVTESNLNRQLVALRSTLGRNKAEVMRDRALDINPEGDFAAVPEFYNALNRDAFDFGAFDYVADCIDQVSSKLLIIEGCSAAGTPVISALGAGNRLGARFEVRDIFSTSGDPLARIMRKELRRRGTERLNVVFSLDEPLEISSGEPNVKTVGSISYVPSAAGLTLAGRIIRELSGVTP